MRSNESSPGEYPAWSAAGMALFFLYLESLKAMRSSQWSGLLPSDWLGVGMTGLFYALLVWALVVGIRRGTSGLGLRVPGCALFVAGTVLWGLLSTHREETPTLDDGIVAVVLAGFSFALWLGNRTGRYSEAQLGGALIVLWLSGLAALHGAGHYFLFSPHRAREVTLFPALWLAPVGLGLATVLCWKSRTSLLAVGGVVGVATPLLAVFALLYTPARDDGAQQPNMVFLISDTLRADYCSVYGGDVPTPRLEAMADSGTRFDRHYALSPWTLPSMTGLFSSQYPKSLTPDSDHEAWILQMNQYEVDYDTPTLPMRLEEAGYRTGAFTANAFLPVVPGMMFGYQDRASAHPILLEDNGYFNQLPFLSAALRAWCPVLVDIRPHNTTHDLDHYARAFIRRHRDKPFFLWIHYIDPHAPYDPPEDLRRVTEGPWPFFHPYVGGEAWGIPILGKNFSVAQPDQDYVRSLYEGEVAYIDGFVGRIQDALTEAGIAEKTLFCFTSDHGEELWDHGGWGHGQSLYDEMIRVPLIVAGPGIASQVVSEPVSAIDLVPTLADLLDVAPADTWQGTSLGPVLRGDATVPPDRPVFSHGTSNKSTENPQHMVVVGDYKLIRMAGSDRVSLYDLATDPGETKDVAAAHPEVVARLTTLLDEWLASFPAYFDEAPAEFNREMEQGLEGMGYL